MKTSDSGVYSLFSKDDDSWAWGEAITRVGQRMCAINKGFEHLGLDVQLADRFVKERIEGVRGCLIDLTRLCSFGHFRLDEHLMTVREMLSAIGEAHSAHNSYLILKSMGINARLMDLSGWMDTEQLSLDDTIRKAFESVDVAEELPIVTGYTQCREGIMGSYDRGYTEITFSRIAVLTGAREGIIHKEYHLSSGDPKIIGENRVETIGSTDYDVADQLSDLGMEAIHPGAARGLRKTDIPLRIKNVFEPDHPGTLTHYIAAPLAKIKRLTENIKQDFPSADILVKKAALVSAIGTNMADTWVLPTAVHSLTNAGVEILGLHKCMRQVDIQFVVSILRRCAGQSHGGQFKIIGITTDHRPGTGVQSPVSGFCRSLRLYDCSLCRGGQGQ